VGVVVNGEVTKQSKSSTITAKQTILTVPGQFPDGTLT